VSILSAEIERFLEGLFEPVPKLGASFSYRLLLRPAFEATFARSVGPRSISGTSCARRSGFRSAITLPPMSANRDLEHVGGQILSFSTHRHGPHIRTVTSGTHGCERINGSIGSPRMTFMLTSASSR